MVAGRALPVLHPPSAAHPRVIGMVLDVPTLGLAPPTVRNGHSLPHDRPAPETATGLALDLRSVLEIVGAVAAPTTLLGGLALYFGVAYVNSQAFYFGIDGSTLGFSTRDYLLRTADALFVPLGTLAFAAVALLGTDSAVTRWVGRPDRRRAASVTAWVLSTVGALLFTMGAAAVFRPLPSARPSWFHR